MSVSIQLIYRFSAIPVKIPQVCVGRERWGVEELTSVSKMYMEIEKVQN